MKFHSSWLFRNFSRRENRNGNIFWNNEAVSGTHFRYDSRFLGTPSVLTWHRIHANTSYPSVAIVWQAATFKAHSPHWFSFRWPFVPIVSSPYSFISGEHAIAPEKWRSFAFRGGERIEQGFFELRSHDSTPCCRVHIFFPWDRLLRYYNLLKILRQTNLPRLIYSTVTCEPISTWRFYIERVILFSSVFYFYYFHSEWTKLFGETFESME